MKSRKFEGMINNYVGNHHKSNEYIIMDTFEAFKLPRGARLGQNFEPFHHFEFSLEVSLPWGIPCSFVPGRLLSFS